MSQEEDGKLLRTVTRPYRGRTDEEMNIVALVYVVGLLVVLVPLLPFIVLVWVLSKVSEALTGEGVTE